MLVQLQLDYCGSYSGTARFRVNRVYIVHLNYCFLTKRGTLCEILKYLKHTVESIARMACFLTIKINYPHE